jgi:hypothetical protein
MRNHAWEYGFVMSYPKGKLDITCYDFEPWHFKYVGREVAAAIHASGLTQREYLWANYTTTVVPAKTPKPHHSARPTETPPSTVQPSVEPSDEPSTAPATPGPASAPPSNAPPSAAPPTLVPPTEVPGTEVPGLPPLDVIASITRDPAMLAAVAVAVGALLLGLAVIGWKVLRGRRTT